MLLVAVLPWIHLRAHARMHADLAASGLRALDLLEGRRDDRPGDRRVVPPLPVWVHAVALSLPTSDKSLALAMPSAVFGALSGFVLYRLGRAWYSPAVGVLSALLLVCNRTLLEQIRWGEPGPVVLFLTLASLWPFAEHAHRQEDVFSRWTLVGALAMAGLFLTAGTYAVLIAALGLGAMFFRGDPDDSRPERLRKALFDPTTRAGVVTVLLGAALASPWLAAAPWRWGPWFPWEEPNVLPPSPLGWWDAVAAAPVLVVLALFGFLRSARELVREGVGAGREALPILWTLLAALAFGAARQTPAALLVVIAPMILLAARTILDVLTRKLTDRQVLLLATLSVAAYVLWQTPDLTGVPLKVRSGIELLGRDWLAILLGAVGVWTTLVVLTVLYRWTRDSDARRRSLFGALVVAVIAVACAPGAMLLRSKPRTQDPWHQVQRRLAGLIESERPDTVLILDGEADARSEDHDRGAVVLEFFARTSAPKADQRLAGGPAELERALADYERPLVVVTRTARRLPKIYSLAHGPRALTLTERFGTDRVALYSPLAARAAD